MKKLLNLPIAVRLIAVIAAVGVTFVLLATVLSIAAPQRDILIAKAGHMEHRAAAPVAVAMLSTGIDSLRK